MKKIFTLALAVCSVLAVSAQQISKADLDAKKVNFNGKLNNVERKVVPFAPKFENSYVNGQFPTVKERIAQVKADAVLADTAFYIASPDLVYYGGNYENGYSTYPMLLQPTSEDVTFYNLSTFADPNAMFGWTLDGENLISQDTDLVAPAGTFEGPGYYMEGTPIFMMESGEYYYWGIGQDDEGLYWMAYPDFYMPITKCRTYTSTAYDENGIDSYPWAFSQTVPYIFGSGLDLTAYGWSLVDTLGTPFGIEGAQTAIDSINIMVISWEASTVQIGNALTLDICNVTKSGNSMLIDTDSPVVSHTATNADITWQQAGNGYAVGIVTFPVKATMNGEFWIQLRGLNGTGANFGIFADGADEFGVGDTYMITMGEFKNFFGMNIDMSVNCIITEGAAEGIHNNHEAVKATKTIENGQVVIRRGDRVYNALGKEISK